MRNRKVIWVVAAFVILLPIVTLAILSFLSSPPVNLGVADGQLAPCPDKPNCVSTQSHGERLAIRPLLFDGDREQTIAHLKTIINSLPRSTIVSETPNYIHAEFRSLVFRFVDDVEFYVDDESKVIHFRSASRVGHSDLGVNRARMEQIRKAFEGQSDLESR